MALIRCPECAKEVSDSASACPHCGFDLAKSRRIHAKTPFIPVVNPLSKVKNSGAVEKKIWGAIFTVFGILLIPTGGGIPLIIIGFLLFVFAFAGKTGYQFGKCPYCGTELQVVSGNPSFQCPICNNVGKQTASALESTHETEK